MFANHHLQKVFEMVDFSTQVGSFWWAQVELKEKFKASFYKITINDGCGVQILSFSQITVRNTSSRPHPQDLFQIFEVDFFYV
jgi:hypothetical protein